MHSISNRTTVITALSQLQRLIDRAQTLRVMRGHAPHQLTNDERLAQAKELGEVRGELKRLTAYAL